jgi:hypothetical protein
MTADAADPPPPPQPRLEPLENPCRRVIVPLFYRKHRLTRYRRTAIRLFVFLGGGGGHEGSGGREGRDKEKTTRADSSRCLPGVWTSWFPLEPVLKSVPTSFAPYPCITY